MTKQNSFETLDSGVRAEYASGMVRDTQEGKPRLDLFFVKGLPYEAQPIIRLARLLERGSTKYGDRNWEAANSQEELDRYQSSGLRHYSQHICGETDEDHPAAVLFNVIADMVVSYKLANKEEANDDPSE